MKEKYITWNDIDPIIRERFFIMEEKISDIGYVTASGNLMINYKAIIDAFDEVCIYDYSEEEIGRLVKWINNLLNEIGIYKKNFLLHQERIISH